MDVIYYYLNHYSYLGIFLLLASGIFGPPVADELLLLFLGYLTLLGKIDLPPNSGGSGGRQSLRGLPGLPAGAYSG